MKKRSADEDARVVAAALIIAATLSGCTAQPIVARIDRGELEFRVCDSLQATAIEIQTAPQGTTAYETVWRVGGPPMSTLDQIFIYGVEPEGWTTDVQAFELTLDRAISVTIGDSPSVDDAKFYSVTFDGSELTKEWRDSEGQPAPAICD